LARIQSAALLVGGRRQLSYFPDFKGETLAITTNIEVVVARLQAALRAGAGVVVLASGDPLCYGIGATLRRYLPPEQLEIVPAPSAFQLAFAALAEPWAEAALLSAHARPLSQVVAGVRAAPLAAILTDNHHTPAVIAEALQQAQLAPDSPVAICENLGGPGQRLVRTCLAEVGQQSYAPLNVFVIWPRPLASTQNPPLPLAPGLPDEAFATSAGQLTKREVRLLSLAELALGPNEVMWDIGAGSGAVSIEAGRAQPTARLYAVEKRATLCEYLQENLRRFPTPNLHWVEGVAPAATTAWPDPDAVFIGGSGGRLAELIGVAQQRLRPGGRLVLNLATLEHLHLARTLLPSARLIQAQFSRGVPILELLRFEALNPIFIVAWQKER
jgi:precorrin-6Y C5,15-methyltransferase (decarboxylating)